MVVRGGQSVDDVAWPKSVVAGTSWIRTKPRGVRSRESWKGGKGESVENGKEVDFAFLDLFFCLILFYFSFFFFLLRREPFSLEKEWGEGKRAGHDTIHS